jgi:hypothetical protein
MTAHSLHLQQQVARIQSVSSAAAAAAWAAAGRPAAPRIQPVIGAAAAAAWAAAGRPAAPAASAAAAGAARRPGAGCTCAPRPTPSAWAASGRPSGACPARATPAAALTRSVPDRMPSHQHGACTDRRMGISCTHKPVQNAADMLKGPLMRLQAYPRAVSLCRRQHASRTHASRQHTGAHLLALLLSKVPPCAHLRPPCRSQGQQLRLGREHSPRPLVCLINCVLPHLRSCAATCNAMKF